MNIQVVRDSAGAALAIPLSFLFWGFVAAYALHILEESVLGDVFVEKVKRLYWSQYSWGKFAGFNTILLCLEIISVVLYEILGGAWVIFPLSLMSERFFNGFYHLCETLATRKFSSGLLTSVLFWILGYFVIRYGIVPGNIDTAAWVIAAATGFVISLAMTGVLALGVMKRAWRGKD